MNGGRKIKITIIILSVLLMLSLLVLGGIILHNHLSEGKSTEVTVPANVITGEKRPDFPESDDGFIGDGAATSAQNVNIDSTVDGTTTASEAEQTDESATATVISLHARRAEGNTAFQAKNMFPGDSETKYYCVQVSHKDDVTLYFHADIRPGYEKLAEVLNCRISLPEKNTVLFDGLMRDMPNALKQTHKTSGSTKSEVYYEITAYLKTSVGNEYMDKSLIADFRWWVEETGHLDPSKTGDSSNLYLWMGMADGSLLVLLLLVLKKRKQEDAASE